MFDAAEIARRLESKPITVDRVLKARRLANTNRVAWADVITYLQAGDPERSNTPMDTDPAPTPVEPLEP